MPGSHLASSHTAPHPQHFPPMHTVLPRVSLAGGTPCPLHWADAGGEGHALSPSGRERSGASLDLARPEGLVLDTSPHLNPARSGGAPLSSRRPSTQGPSEERGSRLRGVSRWSSRGEAPSEELQVEPLPSDGERSGAASREESEDEDAALDAALNQALNERRGEERGGGGWGREGRAYRTGGRLRGGRKRDFVPCRTRGCVPLIPPTITGPAACPRRRQGHPPRPPAPARLAAAPGGTGDQSACPCSGARRLLLLPAGPQPERPLQPLPVGALCRRRPCGRGRRGGALHVRRRPGLGAGLEA